MARWEPEFLCIFMYMWVCREWLRRRRTGLRRRKKLIIALKCQEIQPAKYNQVRQAFWSNLVPRLWRATPLPQPRLEPLVYMGVPKEICTPIKPREGWWHVLSVPQLAGPLQLKLYGGPQQLLFLLTAILFSSLMPAFIRTAGFAQTPHVCLRATLENANWYFPFSAPFSSHLLSFPIPIPFPLSIMLV